MSNGIGERIRKLREEKGLTQQQLAKEMYVKRETVNQWENETRDLKTGYTISLADFFGVTCDYILRGIKSENIDVNRSLGLSDKSIDILKNENECMDSFIPVLNFLIEQEEKPPKSIYDDISVVTSMTDEKDKISLLKEIISKIDMCGINHKKLTPILSIIHEFFDTQPLGGEISLVSEFRNDNIKKIVVFPELGKDSKSIEEYINQTKDLFIEESISQREIVEQIYLNKIQIGFKSLYKKWNNLTEGETDGNGN